MASSVFCWFALSLLLFAFASAWPNCANGMTCVTLTPSVTPELTFDCAYVKATTNPVGNVLYLHGNDGAGAKAMWASQMLVQARLGFTGLACDARGYSPGASPNNQSAYLYDELAKDLFSLADTFGFGNEYRGKFHVVAHDQGARVTWHAIAKYQGRKRFLSFSSLSIPHSDVFSDSLIGPNADRDQQEAAQYVRMLTLPNAMTVDHGRIRGWLCKQENYKTTQACQHAHWWYNGAIDSGAMALAPIITPYTGAAKYVGIPAAQVRQYTQYNVEGVYQSVKVQHVTEFPVLYACGAKDSADLCKPKFGDQSGKLIKHFTYLRMPHCGHMVIGCAGLQDAITANIQAVYDDEVVVHG